MKAINNSDNVVILSSEPSMNTSSKAIINFLINLKKERKIVRCIISGHLNKVIEEIQSIDVTNKDEQSLTYLPSLHILYQQK